LASKEGWHGRSYKHGKPKFTKSFHNIASGGTERFTLCHFRYIFSPLTSRSSFQPKNPLFVLAKKSPLSPPPTIFSQLFFDEDKKTSN
jgi:hypothetical protein